MASPFRLFRKHQRIMLAVFGVLLMIAFLILPPLMDVGMSGAGPQNPVVVETSFGSLTERELDLLRQQRAVLGQFINGAAQLSFQAHRQIPEGYYPRPETLDQITHRAAMENLLLAKMAEDMGMVVSNDAINAYLGSFRLTEDQFRALINNQAVGGRRATMNDIFAALRQDILARQVEELYLGSSQLRGHVPDYGPAQATPAEQWAAYRKLHAQASIQALVLPVEDFIGEVREPDEQEIERFYEKHKDVVERPQFVFGTQLASPIPGFKRPAMAQFEYIVADYETFLAAAKEQITEKEIANYYEGHKRQYEKLKLLPGKKEEEDGSQPKTGVVEEGQPPEPLLRPEGIETPKNGDDPAAENDESGKQSNLRRPSEAVEVSAQTASEGRPTGGAADQLQFVSFQADEPPADDASPTASPDASQQGTPDVVEKTTSPETDASDATPAAEEKATTDDADVSEKPDGENGTEEKEPEKKEPEPEYKPLEEVRDEIRDRLADLNAVTMMESALRPLIGDLRENWRPELQALRADGGVGREAPLPEGFAATLKADRLSPVQSTGLVTQYELAELAVGKTQLPPEDMPGRDPVRLSRYVFESDFGLFRPQMFHSTMGDGDGSRYLVWKSKEQEPYVPELNEIRAQVVRAWKIIQARDEVLKKAKELAKEAREKSGTLKEIFGESKYQVVEPAAFSWLTEGTVQGRPRTVRLSEISSLNNVGEDFMRVVFSLEEGEVGVAMNHPQTVAYVVQLLDYLTTLDALRKDFLAGESMPAMIVFPGQSEPMTMNLAARLAVGRNQEQINQSLQDELERRYGVDWEALDALAESR